MYGEMLAGRKTMARIAMAKQPTFPSHVVYAELHDGKFYDDIGKMYNFQHHRQFPIREPWRRREGGYEYRSDCDDSSDRNWVSHLMMPLAAARTWMEITDIYIERFSELHPSEFDAEGIRLMKFLTNSESYWDYVHNRYSAKTKLESMESYYILKYPDLRRSDWMWVIHFQTMSAL